MEQQRRHAAIKLEIQLRDKDDISKQLPPDTGTDITYNLKHAMKKPELLEKYMHGNRIQITFGDTKTTTENWEIAKNTIRKMLLQVYPIAQDNHQRQIWENKGYELETTEEKGRTAQLNLERGKIQLELTKRDKK